MVETMRREGHTALVHTAAASNLGQMLNRLCLADGVPLVNIVRRPEQASCCASSGAEHVCDSIVADVHATTSTDALVATGATLAFDAIGGGTLGRPDPRRAWRRPPTRERGEYSRYGSTIHKQVYIYGGLDRGPTELDRNFGMAWGIGGWLLTPFLAKVGPDGGRAACASAWPPSSPPRSPATTPTSLPRRGAAASTRSQRYGKQATGAKYLITPHA